MRVLSLVIVAWLGTLHAADLEPLRATLAVLRARAISSGALPPPELTIAKHQLRDWIEAQLADFPPDGDRKALASRINQELKGVDGAASNDDNLLGTVGDVRIEQQPGMLIVITGVGILCQVDQSAYAYRRAGNAWRRVWESEQNNYAEDKYSPQFISDVYVWHGNAPEPFFVLRLGFAWGCASAWHPVSFSVSRVDSRGSTLLIDEKEPAYLDRGSFIMGSIGGDFRNPQAPVDVLIEFAQGSIDVDVHNREAVRHFQIEGDRVRRVHPVALSPRDFVDEWLSRPSTETDEWTEPSARSRKPKFNFVSFLDTRHCRTPDFWQVGVEQESKPLYFLVRWRPPYRFTMVDIAPKPWPACTEIDPEADQWRTLFNTQDWRN